MTPPWLSLFRSGSWRVATIATYYPIRMAEHPKSTGFTTCHWSKNPICIMFSTSVTGWNIQFPFLASRKVFHFPLSPFFAEWQWFRPLGRVLRLLNDNKGSLGFQVKLAGWNHACVSALLLKHGFSTRASLEALNFLSWQWVALKPAWVNAFHVPCV